MGVQGVVGEGARGWVYESWMVAGGIHTCFYEGWCSVSDVEKAVEYIGRLVKEVASRVRKQ